MADNNETFSPEADAILNELADSDKPFAPETLSAFDLSRKEVREVLIKHPDGQVVLKSRAEKEVMRRLQSLSKKYGSGNGSHSPAHLN